MATKSRADQIYKRFKAFHIDNPEVWRLFNLFANEIRARQDFYSAHAVLHRVRWEIDFTTGDIVKVNNDFSAYYSRMYLATHPQAEGFFKLRRRDSADRAAFKKDLSVYDTGEPGSEEELMAELEDLAEIPDENSSNEAILLHIYK